MYTLDMTALRPAATSRFRSLMRVRDNSISTPTVGTVPDVGRMYVYIALMESQVWMGGEGALCAMR